MYRQISIQDTPIDMSQTEATIRQQDASIGALVSFLGLVREMNDGQQLTAMELEHYPGMTEKALSGIIDQAEARWPLQAVSVIHRIGRLAPADPIVLVSVASAHRHAAFRACEFIMDYLKTRAPFWKKELTHQGEHWVEAKASDQDAEAGWEQSD